MAFQNCVFVLFNLDENNSVNALRVKNMGTITINRFGEISEFWAVEGSALHGVNIHADATHWGIFDMTNPDNPVSVVHDVLPQDQQIKKIYKVRNYHVIVKRTPKYIKITASEYASAKEAREAKKTNVKSKKWTI